LNYDSTVDVLALGSFRGAFDGLWVRVRADAHEWLAVPLPLAPVSHIFSTGKNSIYRIATVGGDRVKDSNPWE